MTALAGLVAWSVLAAQMAGAGGRDLDASFRNPPDEAKPSCYWYWVNGDISKEGITKDLEAMAKVGIRRAMIGNIEGGGPVKMLSPEWYALTHHALQEAARVGVDIMMFNAPGWSQSGGPWIKPEQSMRRITWSEFPAQGGPFSQKVRPDLQPLVQDVAVLALPRKPAVTVKASEQPVKAGETRKPDVRYFRHTEPFKARALVVKGNIGAKLYALKDGRRVLVAEFHSSGNNKDTDFLPDGERVLSFKEATAQEFELEPCHLPLNAVELTSEPRVAQYIEKQMGRMHPTPSPTWDSYRFKDTVEPDDPSAVVKQSDILNLTDKLTADGKLTCDLPAGDWTVIYFGMVTTGKQNGPAPAEATGLEVDKMSKPLIAYHFDSMFDKLLKEATPAEKKAWKGVTIDSYEKGAQNWTDGFEKDFRRRAGYDPIKLLPVMTGRVIDSAKASDQFLWDLRRIVADMIAENYVGGLTEIAHKHGFTTWCENYGHWGFPGEFLIYGRYADEIGGEFWTAGLGTIECRAGSSACHIYGRRKVYAEAFTSVLDLGSHPYRFKARGEELFCEGINQFVLHVVTHQPRDGAPGKNAWFGTAFHRNNPWFNESRDWVRYLQRVHFMLQQGEPVAQVAVYIGDFAPQMTGPANPVPGGYDYDFIGSDAIVNNLNVVNGKWVVYDEQHRKRIAASYDLMAMPESGYIRPPVLKRIEELKKAGGKTVAVAPVPAEALRQLGINPLVSEATCPIRWKVRKLDDGLLFFLSNFERTGTFEAKLCATGRVPELFNPVTGEIRKLARYKAEPDGTRICIDVQDRADSFFVVFREKAQRPAVADVQAAGQTVAPADLALAYGRKNVLTAVAAKKGAYTLKMSDGTEKTVAFDENPETLAITGPWTSANQDDKGFTQVNTTAFEVPAGFGQGAVPRRILLDLGRVEVMAKVTLNGREFDTLWMPPFVLDVTDALKPGTNQLQVRVTSTVQDKPKLGPNVRLFTRLEQIVK